MCKSVEFNVQSIFPKDKTSVCSFNPSDGLDIYTPSYINTMKKLLIVALLAIAGQGSFAQAVDSLIKWQFKLDHRNLKAGDEVSLSCNATLTKGWQLYVSNHVIRHDIKPLEFEFSENGTFGVIKPVLPYIAFNQEKKYPTHNAKEGLQDMLFRTLVRIEENSFEVSGIIRGHLYHPQSGQLLAFQRKFIVE